MYQPLRSSEQSCVLSLAKNAISFMWSIPCLSTSNHNFCAVVSEGNLNHNADQKSGKKMLFSAVLENKANTTIAFSRVLSSQTISIPFSLWPLNNGKHAHMRISSLTWS